MCPLGTYRDRTRGADVSDCFPCKEKTYCDQPGMNESSDKKCSERFYCESGSLNPFGGTVIRTSVDWGESDWTPCEAGHFCDSGVSRSKMTQCPKGSYSGSKYLRDQCSPCQPGKFCPDKGMTEIPDENKCTAGSYCESGSSKATGSSCSRFYHCPEGSAEEMFCPPGKYQPDRGEGSVALHI